MIHPFLHVPYNIYKIQAYITHISHMHICIDTCIHGYTRTQDEGKTHQHKGYQKGSFLTRRVSTMEDPAPALLDFVCRTLHLHAKEKKL